MMRLSSASATWRRKSEASCSHGVLLRSGGARGYTPGWESFFCWLMAPFKLNIYQTTYLVSTGRGRRGKHLHASISWLLAFPCLPPFSLFYFSFLSPPPHLTIKSFTYGFIFSAKAFRPSQEADHTRFRPNMTKDFISFSIIPTRLIQAALKACYHH